jgi:hypothetical protein
MMWQYEHSTTLADIGTLLPIDPFFPFLEADQPLLDCFIILLHIFALLLGVAVAAIQRASGVTFPYNSRIAAILAHADGHMK